ncbi:MAG: undecaprenyl-diphosphate phosphatase [Candidatus Altiarchaeota archaeon]
MDVSTGILAGVLQGLLEWLPVSSSGQGMILLSSLLGFDAFSALEFMFILHSGTLLAAVVKFRDDFKDIASDIISMKSTPMLRFISTSTISSFAVGGVIYLFLRELLDEAGSGFVMLLVGLFLMATGIALSLSKRAYGSGSVSDLSLIDTVSVGLAQGFSVFPGLSRSGVTIASLLLSDLKQEEALRLSFIMSVPVVFAATIAGFNAFPLGVSPLALIAGISAAFIVGYATIDVLMKASQKLRFDLFCVLFGLVSVLWVVAPVLF